jgi:uncharacterized membrane protein SpoIIM required for sporulation
MILLIILIFIILPISYYLYVKKDPKHLSINDYKSLNTEELKKRINYLRRKRLLTRHNFLFHEVASGIYVTGQVEYLKYISSSQIKSLPNNYQKYIGYKDGTKVKKIDIRKFYDSQWQSRLLFFLGITGIVSLGIIFLLGIYVGFTSDDSIDCSSPNSYGERVACNRAYERAFRER